MPLTDVLLKHASQAYAIDYLGIVILLLLLEWVTPRRSADGLLRTRWMGNISLGVLDTMLVRVLFPLVGFGWAAFCRERGWGLFNQRPLPEVFGFCSTLFLLDLFSYAQHYLLHNVSLLWRLHRTHHTDHEYDFTTGLRFHPLEATYTTIGSLVVILMLGAPPSAVLVSQLLTVASAFFVHSNVRIPLSLDRVVRLFLVTPDMHRIHHSQLGAENRSNFGGFFPWWDRLFGTYVDQPAAGHEGIAFGLPGFSGRRHLTLRWMLAQPFLSGSGQIAEPSRTSVEEARSSVLG